MKDKWYFKPLAVVLGFLMVGPFVLPLVWVNPVFKRSTKIIMTIIILILTYFVIVFFVNSLKTIGEYYQLMTDF